MPSGDWHVPVRDLVEVTGTRSGGAWFLCRGWLVPGCMPQEQGLPASKPAAAPRRVPWQTHYQSPQDCASTLQAVFCRMDRRGPGYSEHRRAPSDGARE